MGFRRAVILGNGGAAIAAAKAARTSGYKGEIHIVSDTNTPAFNPMLSPYYLKGLMSWEHCFPFGTAFYRDYNIIFHGGNRVESLDIANQQAILGSGEKLGYDCCLIATGANPAIPSIPGIEGSSRCLSLRSAASVKLMEQATFSAGKAVVLGASLVGLKVAEALTKKNLGVVLVDVADQILPGGMHRLSAEIVCEYLKDHGVHIRLGCTVSGVEETDRNVVCHFPQNVIEQTDVVAVCTGVQPNLGFIHSNDIAIDDAVLVDTYMHTSADNVYAAGDASQGINLLSGERQWLGTWVNASQQGRTAGCNMAGKETSYAGSIPQNITPLFKWMYAQLGDVRCEGADTRTLVFGDPRREGFFVLLFQHDVLIGANLINCTELAGRLRTAMMQRWNWEPYLRQTNRFTRYKLEQILNKYGAGRSRPQSEPRGHKMGTVAKVRKAYDHHS